MRETNTVKLPIGRSSVRSFRGLRNYDEGCAGTGAQCDWD